jgi:hypothetical protein
MLDLTKIPDAILQDIQENCTSPEYCTVEEALGHWLDYQGIIGYTKSIIDTYEVLKAAHSRASPQ